MVLSKRVPVAAILPVVSTLLFSWPLAVPGRSLLQWLILPLLLLPLSACAPAEPPPTLTPTATVVPSPTIVPTPTLSAQFSDLTILEIGSDGPVVLGYIENSSSYPVADLLLQVALFDEQGELVDGALFSPLYPDLEAGDQSPFRVQFPPGEQSHETLVEVVSYRPINRAPARPQIEILERTVTNTGDVTLIGQIIPGELYRVDRVIGISTREEGTPTAWLEAGEYAAVSTPERPAMFSLTVPAEHLDDDLALYPVGEAAGAAPDVELEFSISPSLLLSAQDDPFVFGEVHNPSESAAPGRILLTFRRADQLLAFHSLPIPMPLPAGGTLAFSVADLPIIDGLIASDLAALDEISLEHELEGVIDGQSRTAARLGSEILEFEVIGSTAFLRARIENSHSEAVNQPTVFAALRSTAGSLQTAAWASPGESIAAGERLEALIQIPLPEGVNVFRGEFDIWAAGWSAAQ